jgi:hypothetical protein
MDFDAWKKEVDAKVAGIDAAIEVLTRLKESYVVASYGARDELSPARRRKLANKPWESED